jgi:2-(1,2-epoxy-1,2-dihydrophenyl)acetyl-CoA isomerase
MADTADAAAEVTLADREGVRWVTINRPQAGNAISLATRATLIDCFEAAGADPLVRAVVLTATGSRHFCTGADLRAQQGTPRPEGIPERIAGDIARGIRVSAQRLIASILDCDKPVVAAVNGTAAGMGVQLALACDFVIAAESARFIEVYIRRALVPDAGAAYLLPRLIGVHRAKELLMLGDDVTAEQARSIGLINRIVPDDELPDAAAALAQRLASGPTRALALAKWLVNRSLDGSRSASFDDEAIAQDLNMHTADGQEGLASFVERRPAEYRGW